MLLNHFAIASWQSIELLLLISATEISFLLFAIQSSVSAAHSSATTETGGKLSEQVSPVLSSNAQEVLSRSRRGIATPGKSIMEAVATGSAGTSGELIPLVFKVSMAALLNRPISCHINHDFVLLGFGDAVLPGLFPV